MSPLTLHAPNGPAGADSVAAVADSKTPPAKRSAAELAPLLLSAADLAQLLRVSVPTIWRLRAAGKLPRPLDALGKQLIRWDADEVRRWIVAKMPDLKTWGAMNRT